MYKPNAVYWLLSLLILALAVYASNAKADVNIYAGAWSDHPFSDYDYNEQHDLAALEYKGVFGGYFKNSYGEDAFAAGYRLTKDWGDFEGGLLVGASYGYRSCIKGWADEERRVCPLIAPMVSYTKHRVQPTLFILGPAVAIGFRIAL